MIRDPEIVALRTELEQLGLVVAPHSDHLCVRLPLFASVRVRLDGAGRLRCEPMFGPLARSRAVMLNTMATALVAGGFFYETGASALALTVAFLGLLSAAGTVCRFVLTESCVTRVQLLWAARLRGRRDLLSELQPAALPPLRAVEVPTPDLTPVITPLRGPRPAVRDSS
jgi:hypothetical protein